MVQFGKNNFISTPQTIKEFDEATVDTEFTLDISSENMTNLIAINLHQLKKDNKKRSKIVGRTTKIPLPKLLSNTQKLKTIKIYFYDSGASCTISETNFNEGAGGLIKKNSSVESLLSMKSDANLLGEVDVIFKPIM